MKTPACAAGGRMLAPGEAQPSLGDGCNVKRIACAAGDRGSQCHTQVYATKERSPLITSEFRPRLHEYLGGTVRALGGIALEINGTTDHVHVRTKSILRTLICGAELLSPASQARQSLFYGFPRLGCASPGANILIACWRRLVGYLISK